MLPQLSISARRATIHLDAPERRNALGPADLSALHAAIERIESDSNVEVAVFTASGTTFCAGYDLRTLERELDDARPSGAHSAFARVVDAVETMRVPTVCVLRGGVFGGGPDLALACDLRIGTPVTTLLVPAARFGLQFYAGGLRRFVERLGIDAAKRIFLLAQPLDAPELHRLGFLHAVTADADVMAEADRMVAHLLANAGTATAGLKRSLGAIAAGTADPAVIDDAFSVSLAAPETRARLRARGSKSA